MEDLLAVTIYKSGDVNRAVLTIWVLKEGKGEEREIFFVVLYEKLVAITFLRLSPIAATCWFFAAWWIVASLWINYSSCYLRDDCMGKGKSGMYALKDVDWNWQWTAGEGSIKGTVLPSTLKTRNGSYQFFSCIITTTARCSNGKLRVALAADVLPSLKAVFTSRKADVIVSSSRLCVLLEHVIYSWVGVVPGWLRDLALHHEVEAWEWLRKDQKRC